jgi:hypothetical protein
MPEYLANPVSDDGDFWSLIYDHICILICATVFRNDYRFRNP